MDVLLRGALLGAASGAAGTTALNATTYLDMAVRGRPASSAPEDVVEWLAGGTGLAGPGDEQQRRNRVSGLGPLMGIAAGVATGAALGAARAAGPSLGVRATSVLAAGAATVAGNLPMIAGGLTDPRRWSLSDWLADLFPHAAYGAVTGVVLCRLDPR